MNVEEKELQIHKMHRARIEKFALGYIESVDRYALSSIRGAFILNGSSAIAAISSKRFEDMAIEHIVLCGVVGSLLAVISAIFQWISQRIYMGATLYSLNYAYNTEMNLIVDQRKTLFTSKNGIILECVSGIILILSLSVFTYSLLLFYKFLQLSNILV